MNKKIRCIINTWLYLILDLVLAYNAIIFTPDTYDLIKQAYNNTNANLSFLEIISSLLILSVSIFLSLLFISGTIVFLVKMIQNLFMFHYYLFFNNFENKISHVYFRTFSTGEILDSYIVFGNGDTLPVKLDKSAVNIEKIVNIPDANNVEEVKSNE